MKTVVKIVILLMVAAAIIYTLVYINTTKHEEKICSGVDINVIDSLSTGLIHENDVRDILNKKKIHIEGQPMDSINNAVIIEALSESPYVDTASCYHTPAGKLCVDVVAMQPVLHVMAANGEEYYLDRKGKTMPIGGLNVNLNIATGHITKDFAAKNLTQLACYIQDDSFWQPLIQQINVASPKHIQLIMRVGESIIDLGDNSGIKAKLNKMRLFINQGLNEAGWDKYSTIDISYKDVVVATLAEGIEKGVATLPVEDLKPKQPEQLPTQATAGQTTTATTDGQATATQTQQANPSTPATTQQTSSASTSQTAEATGTTTTPAATTTTTPAVATQPSTATTPTAQSAQSGANNTKTDNKTTEKKVDATTTSTKKPAA